MITTLEKVLLAIKRELENLERLKTELSERSEEIKKEMESGWGLGYEVNQYNDTLKKIAEAKVKISSLESFLGDDYYIQKYKEEDEAAKEN